MATENNTLKTIEEIKELLDLLPKLSFWDRLLPYLDIPNYGTGQDAYNILKDKFYALDLSKAATFEDLDKEIRKQKREIKELENKHTNLTAIVGENRAGTEGSIAHSVLKNLNSEIQSLIEKRDALLIEEQDLQKNLEKKLIDVETKTTTAISLSNKKINDAEINATSKVKLINQFKDFIEETNNNMKLYNYVIIGVLLAAIIAIGMSVPNLLKVFTSYDSFVRGNGLKITNWQMINFSLGILIVKLPWALCLSAVLTGMYNLLKGLLTTYEKINQDKRNMSAIYAISGNVAQALNEYGITLAENIDDEETGTTYISLKVVKKDLLQKKENFRWNQIMKYFEKMEQHKEVENISDDTSKLKMATSLLDKLINRLPKT